MISLRYHFSIYPTFTLNLTSTLLPFGRIGIFAITEFNLMFNIPYFARFSDGREINFVLEVEDEIHLDDSLHCDRTLDERACDLASAKHDEGTEPFDVEICWTMIPGEKLLAVAGNVFAYVGYDGCFVGPYASFEIAKAALDAHVDYIMEHGP